MKFPDFQHSLAPSSGTCAAITGELCCRRCGRYLPNARLAVNDRFLGLAHRFCCAAVTYLYYYVTVIAGRYYRGTDYVVCGRNVAETCDFAGFGGRARGVRPVAALYAKRVRRRCPKPSVSNLLFFTFHTPKLKYFATLCP